MERTALGTSMIVAQSLKNKVIISADKAGGKYHLERKHGSDGKWLTFTGNKFKPEKKKNTATETFPFTSIEGNTFIPYNAQQQNTITPVPITFPFIDNTCEAGIYQYRARKANKPDSPYKYSLWVRCNSDPIGYTFGNYASPKGHWGEVITPDDLQYTYLWGTDFKAANGTSYTEEQIRFFIDAAVADIERRLNITIKKKRIRYETEKRNLVKGNDYDIEEGCYDFKYSRIARYGTIVTKHRPIIKLHNLDMLNRFTKSHSLTDSTVVDKTKGVLKLMRRPLRPSETSQGIGTAINMYGQETFTQHLFYGIDYDAGYETSDDIPMDLREAIAKSAAISLLNIIGDGLMSGFSSSSLSMDGISESFSSTQSATSAYFGARIKVYEDELANYIEEARRKFGFIQIGVL